MPAARARTRRMRGAARAAALLLLLAGAAGAQSGPELVLFEGHVVLGLGALRGLDGVAIDDHGRTLVTASVDAPAEFDELLLVDGSIVLAEGDAVRGRPGIAYGGWALGHALEARDLRGFPGDADALWVSELRAASLPLGSFGVLHGGRILATTGQPLDAVGLEPGSVLRGLCGLATAGPRALVSVRVATPAGDRRNALVQLGLDERVQSVCLTRDGAVVAGASGARLERLSGHPRALAANADGSWVVAATLLADTAEGALPVGGLVQDGQLLLRDGDPGPLPGTRWSGLARAVVRLAPGGGPTWIADLVQDDGDGLSSARFGGATDRAALVHDGRLVARVGAPVEGADTDLGALASFGVGAPLLVGPGGRVLWFGHFEGAAPERDSALMLGRSVLIREGERTPDGHVLDVLPEQVEGLALSPNGRWLALRATLADGRQAVLRMDLGAATPLPGCTPDAPELSLAAGVVAPGEPLRIVLSQRGTTAPAHARLWYGFELPRSSAPCGRATPQGDLLLEEPRSLGASGRPEGRTRVVFEFHAPPGPWERALVLQAMTMDAGGAVRLSRALRLSAVADRPTRTPDNRPERP